MAKIIGTSDSWKSVCLMLNQANFKPEKPSEIHILLETAKKEYIQTKTNVTHDVQNKIETLTNDIDQQEKNFDIDVQKGKEEISLAIESIQLTLKLLQNGFVHRLLNYFKIRQQKEKLRSLKNRYENYPNIVRRKISQAKDTLEKTKSDFGAIVEKQCQTIARKVKLLENVIKSPEFAGGIAELELIENLKTLPENCFVINDVEIQIDRAIHFDGQWLRSAQIDHVVVTSSGIFVIEVKNWSSKFAQEGNYFDPYQQVKRSSYLCYILIGERYTLKTRSIVAYKGSIPPKPSYSNAKVLPINDVKGYISWFKEPIVSDQVVERVAAWFSNKSRTNV